LRRKSEGQIGMAGLGERQSSGAFLKKGTKKLLSTLGYGWWGG
jgi:hypothetical protein